MTTIKTQTTHLLGTLPPLALYIHMPWCVQKCPYCDFNSHQQSADFDEDLYIEVLLLDVEQSLTLIWGRTVYSIFIGGGTPSLFSGKAISYLLSKLRALLPISPTAEITIEVNPNSAEQENFALYKKSGINRMSIGAQSFNNQQLKKLGRTHQADEITSAFRTARSVGIDNINLDIMFGLPEQSQAEALADLEQALSLKPNHLSWYQLTIEENTTFHHTPPKRLPEHDNLYDTQTAGIAYLKQNGYSRYEVSAFSLAKKQCQHNLNYWQFGDYLGIGAGAHGKISFPDKIIRTTKYRNPQDYLKNTKKTSNTTVLNRENLLFEFMLNALRLTQGFDKSLYPKTTGLPWSSVQETMNQAAREGYIQQTEFLITPTKKGINFSDNLVNKFL